MNGFPLLTFDSVHLTQTNDLLRIFESFKNCDRVRKGPSVQSDLPCRADPYSSYIMRNKGWMCFLLCVFGVPYCFCEDAASASKIHTFVAVEIMSDLQPTKMEFGLALHIRQSSVYSNHAICDVLKLEIIQSGLPMNSDSERSSINIPKPFRQGREEWWKLNLYFSEAKSVTKTSDVIDTTSYQADFDDTDCALIIMSKRAVVVNCELNFKSFPFDEHICTLTLRSFSFTSDSLAFSTTRFFTNPGVQLHEFAFNITTTTVQQFTDWADPLSTFSASAIKFRFRRKFTNQFLTAFLPTSLIVFVSMISLLMDTNAMSERITLCSTALLAQYTQMTVVREELPAISYLTVCDRYMFACFAFCFIVTVESSIVDGIKAQEQQAILGFHKDTVELKVSSELQRFDNPSVKTKAGGRRSDGDWKKHEIKNRRTPRVDEQEDSGRLSTMGSTHYSDTTLGTSLRRQTRLRESRSKQATEDDKNRKQTVSYITPWSNSHSRMTPVLHNPHRAWWQEEREGIHLAGDIGDRVQRKHRLRQLYTLRYQCFRGNLAAKIDTVFKVIVLLTVIISSAIFWSDVLLVSRNNEFIYISEGADLL